MLTDEEKEKIREEVLQLRKKHEKKLYRKQVMQELNDSKINFKFFKKLFFWIFLITGSVFYTYVIAYEGGKDTNLFEALILSTIFALVLTFIITVFILLIIEIINWIKLNIRNL